MLHILQDFILVFLLPAVMMELDVFWEKPFVGFSDGMIKIAQVAEMGDNFVNDGPKLQKHFPPHILHP